MFFQTAWFLSFSVLNMSSAISSHLFTSEVPGFYPGPSHFFKCCDSQNPKNTPFFPLQIGGCVSQSLLWFCRHASFPSICSTVCKISDQQPGFFKCKETLSWVRSALSSPHSAGSLLCKLRYSDTVSHAVKYQHSPAHTPSSYTGTLSETHAQV